MIADDDLNPIQRAAAEQRAGCANGTLTTTEYHDLLLAAGFSDPAVTPTTDAGGGLHSAIAQATKPHRTA